MQVSARSLRAPATRLHTRLCALHSSASVHASTSGSPALSPYGKDFSVEVEKAAKDIARKKKLKTDRTITQLRCNVRRHIKELKQHSKDIVVPKASSSTAVESEKAKVVQAKRTKKLVSKAQGEVQQDEKPLEEAEALGNGSPSEDKSTSVDGIGGETFWATGWPSTGFDGATLSETKDVPTHAHNTIEGLIEPTEGTFHLYDLDPPSEQRPIPRLAHNLDRALFNPGVNWLQDPRSRVFNYTPWLENIPKVKDFDFSRIPGFIKSSMDEDLFRLAKANGAKFAGSTSSLTGMLSQIYFALSGGKEVDTSVLSQPFYHEPRTFTPAQRYPSSTVLWYRNGIYSTDSYSYDSTSDKNVLTWMGTMLEKFLTMPEPAFKQLLRSSPPPPTPVDRRRETCRYAKVGSYVMRSQLDCQDPRLPGTGVFDIKTRASLPIRLDIMNYEENSGYLIRQMHGTLESFEREYYDLIRSAFLKYSFQARIGNMDGVFIAYHNTARIFGFQYVPLEEMDERIYGNREAGPYVFEKCVKLLEIITNEITRHFPEQHIACVWEAIPQESEVVVWAEPCNWEGEPEDKPIVELHATFTNFLAERHIRGDKVLERVHRHPWTVHYQISQSADPIAAIRARQQTALEKQRYVFDLPTGVSVEQMAQIWEEMDFSGGDIEQARSTFSPDRFREPTPNILALRKVAQRGRKRTESEAERLAGAHKVVWEPQSDAFFQDTSAGGDASATSEAQNEAVADVILATLNNIDDSAKKRREGSHYEPVRNFFEEHEESAEAATRKVQTSEYTRKRDSSTRDTATSGKSSSSQAKPNHDLSGSPQN